MNTPRTTSRIALISALSLAAALTACSKQEDDRTAGQKLDGAIADAKQASADAKSDASRSADNAEAKIKDAAQTTSDAMTDAAIVTKINAMLAVDDQLKAMKIDVDAKDGRVTLTGSAPNVDAHARASTFTLSVDGVRSVDNKLVVSPNS